MPRSDEEIAEEFQERRRDTFHRAKPWLVFLALGFGGFLVVYWGKLDAFFAMVAMVFAFIGVFGSVYTVKNYYRCPSCEEPVWDNDGVQLDPEACPHCKTRLKMPRVRVRAAQRITRSGDSS